MFTELSDYPSSHMCMIFAPDNAPVSVAASLNDISEAATGRPITQILELVSSRLESTDRDGDQQMLDSQEFDDFDEEDDEYEEEYFPGDEDMNPRSLAGGSTSTAPRGGFTEATDAFRKRLRRDLLTAKHNGFKVGHLGGLMDGMGCYVSVSIRIAKLGISEEAMQAWQLEPNEYLVAIFHYPAGYKSMDDLKSYDSLQTRRNFGIRIGVSTSYKPTMQEAIQAFTVLSKDEEKRREASQATESQQQATLQKGFRNSFVSRPLNELFDQRLHMLLKYRYSGMPWSGAEAFYNDQVLRPLHTTQDAGSEDKYYEPEHVSTLFPSLVTADHINDSLSSEHSLPLVGMQFLLRHFVRCTEFCLICFSKMPDDLQAIKPYVCDNPLCLYQYMSLGFGPSIEHEILSQPKVVDLLISFCYASARLGRLRDFPQGLSLAVPPPVSNEAYALSDSQYYRGYVPPPDQPASGTLTPRPRVYTAYKARYMAAANELLFEDKNSSCPIGNGSWIVLRADDAPDKAMHCRVIDTSLYPSVKLADSITPMSVDQLQANNYYGTSRPGHSNPAPANTTQAVPLHTKEFRAASFYIYEQNFDDLTDAQKRHAIGALLDLLPQVQDMKKYLVRKSQSPLSTWADRLSPALLGLLRWIIASNRACIVQVDHEENMQNGRKAEDRLYGMPGWAQFRFAMGAPDKERRFIQAVRVTSERLHLQYPTLFAWHGSPMQNWHSIIREGLHFNETLHGRAFGNGVYHALDVGTSLGYTQLGAGIIWPNSELKIQQALALNEIVNAPKEFTSFTPHLVVAQLDWIQTRYLFVKTKQDYAANLAAEQGQKPHDFIQQDPKMTPKGTTDPLIIPIHAISGSRRPKPMPTGVWYPITSSIAHTDRSQKNKRLKPTSGSQYDPIEIDDDDDAASIATLQEDLDIFEDDDTCQHQQESLPTPNSVSGGKGKSKLGGFVSKMFGSKTPNKSLTDYIPGTLDYSTLPMLQMPAWATSSATKRLMKDFKDLIAVQNTTPPHELGWHIDEDKVDNIYQWIVEMHSFDPTLPLAQDMKKRDVKSIVLELRFGKDYPMIPPFVRVIRPRFLGFQQGGGGHVTAGGAMCMQLLTNDGWSAVSSIESVLLQVRMAMASLEPKPARLENGGRADYGVGEAVEAYIRACAVHGWTVPTGFREMAYGGSHGSGSNNPF
jgi:ubiquitin-conjugating enzyme E2 Q